MRGLRRLLGRRSPQSQQRQDTCTCHWLDIGPRCDFCVFACARLGHPRTVAQTNGVHCYCGTPH